MRTRQNKLIMMHSFTRGMRYASQADHCSSSRSCMPLNWQLLMEISRTEPVSRVRRMVTNQHGIRRANWRVQPALADTGASPMRLRSCSYRAQVCEISMIESSAKEEFRKQRGFEFENTIGTPQGHKNTQNHCREHVENEHRSIPRIPSTILPAVVKA